ncbi:AMP-binding protein [Amycolatopsis benzoatilytica]|uniref:AMP-binding protein n=1 Tax=Amycolatopsis benzoatilytica TaxID=346045 RepID=UPI00036A2248|nr:AMP-binding protein [Amycolatopsis benzoatilytica]
MIYRSSFPDVEIPGGTLVEHVLEHAREHGDKTALVDALSGERLSYRDLADGVDAAAAGLAELGVGPGDVVAVLSHNQPRYALAVYAVLRAGAAVAPMNPVLTGEELTKQLALAKAKAVVSSAASAPKAADAALSAGTPHHLVLDSSADWPGPGTPFAKLLTSRRTPPDLEIDPATALAVLPFSSGTTGLPKGVMLTHRNVVANLEQNAAGWHVGSADVVSAALPFFHIYGFVIILATALRAGATIVTLPKYSLAAYLQMVQDYRVTRAFLAPPIVLALASAPEVDRYDLSSLQRGICGAAPLDVNVAERAESRIGVLIRQGYGMTEASPGTNFVPDEEFPTTPAGSVGRLVPNTEARLVDPATGEDSAPGQPGELWVSGPQVMRGYLDNPQASAETIVDGKWLRTGDIVRIDEAGHYWVVDRLKELIKYKGYQIAPAELESVLLTHPDVLDAAVVGVPHREGGEAPKAVVVAAGPTDAQALMDWVAERVAPYKKIREVEFVDEIPKSPSGKVLRRLLRSQAPSR